MIDKIIKELEELRHPIIINDNDLTHNRAIYESIEIVKKYNNNGQISIIRWQKLIKEDDNFISCETLEDVVKLIIDSDDEIINSCDYCSIKKPPIISCEYGVRNYLLEEV